jgi:signal transduction histidine kinase
MLEKEEMKNRHKQDQLIASIESQEAERKRIAFDVHDEIGAMILTSKFFFEDIKTNKNEEQVLQSIEKINALYNEILINIRRISLNLNPVHLERHGLTTALEIYAEKINLSEFTVLLDYHITNTIPFKIELALYRVIQELTSNSIKHSKGSKIEIILTEEESGLELHFLDDGIGLNQKNHSDGLGIKSIENRLSILNSRLEILPSEKGVHFRINIDKSIILSHHEL